MSACLSVSAAPSVCQPSTSAVFCGSSAGCGRTAPRAPLTPDRGDAARAPVRPPSVATLRWWSRVFSLEALMLARPEDCASSCVGPPQAAAQPGLCWVPATPSVASFLCGLCPVVGCLRRAPRSEVGGAGRAPAQHHLCQRRRSLRLILVIRRAVFYVGSANSELVTQDPCFQETQGQRPARRRSRHCRHPSAEAQPGFVSFCSDTLLAVCCWFVNVELRAAQTRAWRKPTPHTRVFPVTGRLLAPHSGAILNSRVTNKRHKNASNMAPNRP